MRDRLGYIGSHMKAIFTDKSWMYLVSLLVIALNGFFRNSIIKALDIGISCWFFVLAVDLFFKSKEASELMHSRETARVANLTYLLMGISILILYLISTSKFLLSGVVLVLHGVVALFIIVSVEHNIRIFFENLKGRQDISKY